MSNSAAALAQNPQSLRFVARQPIFDRQRRLFGYELLFRDDSLKVGKPIAGRLRITDGAGKPFTQLEPVMDSFAHLVGFYEDRKTVLHIHPNGAPVLSPGARGGPDLEFQFYAMRPGVVRLFAQVQIADAPKIVPFAIQITQ